MKIAKNYYRLLAIGLLILNFDFIINHFVTISDVWIGTTKGLGLGIMIGSLFLISNHKRKHNIKSCGEG